MHGIAIPESGYRRRSFERVIGKEVFEEKKTAVVLPE